MGRVYDALKRAAAQRGDDEQRKPASARRVGTPRRNRFACCWGNFGRCRRGARRGIHVL